MAKRRPSGDGMVRRREDGRWEGRIVVGHKQNGEPIFRYVLAKTQKELLDKLSKIVRLPPAIESYRQRLDETQRAVDKMRVEKEPEALVKYPVQGSLYEHQVRAANMALLTFGLADPKEVLK